MDDDSSGARIYVRHWYRRGSQIRIGHKFARRWLYSRVEKQNSRRGHERICCLVAAKKTSYLAIRRHHQACASI